MHDLAESHVEPFGPMELHAASRAAYVSNETDEQYTAEQPSSMLHKLGTVYDLVTDDETRRKLLLATADWLQEIGSSIFTVRDGAGVGEFEDVAGLVHDILWEHGEHPYHDLLAELEESLHIAEEEAIAAATLAAAREA